MYDNTEDGDESDAPDGARDPDELPVSVRHDWKPPCQLNVAIVRAVAAATGRRTTDLPPLQRYVDFDALDTLVAGGSATPIRISFSYAGVTVIARSTGSIEVFLD